MRLLRDIPWQCSGPGGFTRRLVRDQRRRDLLRVWVRVRDAILELWTQFDVAGQIEGTRSILGWAIHQPVLRWGSLGLLLAGGVGLSWTMVSTGGPKAQRSHGVTTPAPAVVEWAPQPAPGAAPTTGPAPQLARLVEVPTTRPAMPLAVPPPLSDLDRLKARYVAARETCIRRLSLSPQYQIAKSQMNELESRVRMLREGGSPAELSKVSQKWIQAKSRLATLVALAMNSDPEVQRTEMALRGLGLIRTGWQNPAGFTEARNADLDPQTPQVSAGGEAASPGMPAN